MIAATVKALDTLVPPTTLVDSAGSAPDLSAAPALAAIFGADATGLLSQGSIVAADLGIISTTVQAAVPILATAVADYARMATEFVAQAVRLMAQVMVPNPAISGPALLQLAALPGQTLAKALARAAQLERELAPHTARLQTVGSVPLPALTGRAVTPESTGYAAVATATTPASLTGAPTAEATSPAASRAVDAALSQLGTPYVWGGQTPGAGFDCSGLVQWAYRQAGIELPRTAAAMAIGPTIPYDQLQPGDLAVWSGHVAMYIGDNQMVEAGNPVEVSELRTTNGGMEFKGFYRPAEVLG